MSAILLIRTGSSRLADLIPYADKILMAIASVQNGQLTRVE